MKLPMLPCHSAAATVGMVMMTVVSNSPMPPCCMACELRPSASLTIELLKPFARHSFYFSCTQILSFYTRNFF
ncbi:hypothetical protein ACWA5G_02175 [Xanthomonas axonopodis pv. ricini]|uniref:hypothetical protein n=1 Tax=Xanthomonas euvesicatoria TaxID=456327 RepID=UPI002458F919|nr:hypothetical protein [Xanthomonas euvesicatoria]MDH4909767.1 hypothetical protein [Xanthomonas euvesicatoria]